MEIEGADSVEPAGKIEIAHGGQGRKLIGAGHHRRTEAEPVLDRHSEALHQGAGVFAETLLTGHQWIAMMGVFHLALVEVRRHAHVVMGRQQQAASLSRQEFLEGLDFFDGRLLLRHHMIEAEDHHRIGVGQDTIVDRQFLPGLIDALIYRDRFAGHFLSETLKPYRRQMKQLQCACNALQEHLFREFRRFITRPRHPAHFRHGRKAIVQLR